MKKLIATLIGLGLVATASAAEWVTPSFLSVPSIQVTNLMNVTNLNQLSGGTNTSLVVYTNFANVRVAVGVTTNASGNDIGKYENLLTDVSLSALSLPSLRTTGDTNNYGNWQGPVAIYVSVTGGSGANTAIPIRFAPVFGNKVGTQETFVFAVTPSGATRVTIKTNLPLSVLNNATALRCLDITNPDADASSQVVVSDLGLIQLKP